MKAFVNRCWQESDTMASLPHMDMSLTSTTPSVTASASDAASDTMQVGADAAGRELVEEVSPGSLTQVSPNCNKPDGQEGNPRFLPPHLERALNSLVERIHDTVNADPNNARSKSPIDHRSKPAKESVFTPRSQSRSLVFPQKGRKDPASITPISRTCRGRMPGSESASCGRTRCPSASASVPVQRTVSATSPSAERRFTRAGVTVTTVAQQSPPGTPAHPSRDILSRTLPATPTHQSRDVVKPIPLATPSVTTAHQSRDVVMPTVLPTPLLQSRGMVKPTLSTMQSRDMVSVAEITTARGVSGRLAVSSPSRQPSQGSTYATV